MVKQARSRPFPWKCGECFQTAVYMSEVAFTKTWKINRGGVLYDVTATMTLPTCRNCGAHLYSNREDELIEKAADEQINA
jgi:hypothetical protein